MRLIDAEALYEIAKNIWDHADSEDFEKEIFIAIATAPTIEERKAGKWNCGDDIYEYAICSACRNGFKKVRSDPRWRYCPYCGR